MNGFLKIRKSEKQWRHKMYKVKPSQLLKVFDSPVTSSSPHIPDNSDNRDNHLPNKDVLPQKAARQSKMKARITMQQQSRSRLVNIKEKLRKKNIDKKFVDLVFHFHDQAQTSADNLEPNEDSDNYLSLTEEGSDESIVTQEQSAVISVTTMGDTCREVLQSYFNEFSDNPSEASWEEDDPWAAGNISTNLDPALNRNILFPSSQMDIPDLDIPTIEDNQDEASDSSQSNSENAVKCGPPEDDSDREVDNYEPSEEDSDEEAGRSRSPIATRSRSNPDVRHGSASSSIDVQVNQFRREDGHRKPVTPGPRRSRRVKLKKTQESLAAQDNVASAQHH